MQDGGGGDRPLGPVDPVQVPRFAGPATYARLPRLDQVGRVRCRGGRRAVRQRRDVPARRPVRSVGDPGRLAADPRRTTQASRSSRSRPNRSRTPATSRARRSRSTRRSRRSRRARASCWDRRTRSSRSAATTRSRCRCSAPCTRDTGRSRWSTSTRTWTPGTRTSAPRTRTARRSDGRTRRGCSRSDRCAHVGIRGPLFSPAGSRRRRRVRVHDRRRVRLPDAVASTSVADELRERVGDAPVYMSIDVDVMDPAHAPGTGTPEAGGLDQPGAARDAPRARRDAPGRRRRRRGRARLRPRRDHVDRGGERRVRAARAVRAAGGPMTTLRELAATVRERRVGARELRRAFAASGSRRSTPTSAPWWRCEPRRRWTMPRAGRAARRGRDAGPLAVCRCW